MTTYNMIPGTLYADWADQIGPWHSFYHQASSGPSKSSQRLALWFLAPNGSPVIQDWPYLEVLNLTPDKIKAYYHCSPSDALVGYSLTQHFCYDVEKRFV